jgi:hypothetical protein
MACVEIVPPIESVRVTLHGKASHRLNLKFSRDRWRARIRSLAGAPPAHGERPASCFGNIPAPCAAGALVCFDSPRHRGGNIPPPDPAVNGLLAHASE